MSKPEDDAQLSLKKRARRRLVGATALALLAAVVLPMVMDQAPQSPVQDVQIRIPGQDDVPPLNPRAGADKPAAAAVASNAAGNAAERGTGRSSDQPLDKAAEKAAGSGTEKAAPKADEKPAAKTAEKTAENAAGKLAEKPAEKPAEKSTDKPAAKPADKAAERVAEKPVAKPAEKAAEKPSEKAAKPVEKAATGEAQRAADILAGKANGGTAKPAAGAEHVILIGAFANPANVKQLQGKLGELGIKVYTEALDSPQGKKTRVRAGPFPNREAAEKALDRMKRIGVNGVVAAK